MPLKGSVTQYNPGAKLSITASQSNCTIYIVQILPAGLLLIGGGERRSGGEDGEEL